MKAVLYTAAGGLFALTCSLAQAQDEARIWRAFLEAKEDGAPLPMADFSYAGYDYAESPLPEVEGPVFHVGAYGALPDDELSDRDAIQAAIEAAQAAAGGLVAFDAGRYYLNTLGGSELPIRIKTGSLVLRGAGSGPGGTELYFPRHLEPEDPAKMYSTPFLLQIGPDQFRESLITQVLEGGRRGEYVVTVADASSLRVGEWVTLRLSSVEAVESVFCGRPIRPEWTHLKTRGIQATERHSVVGIEGNVVRFREPLQMDVNAEHGWELCDYPGIESLGIEQLRFTGDWTGDFVHHRSALDDGGWSGIHIRNARNSWIRDVVFHNWNYGMRLDNCAAFSVLRVAFTGTLGHHSYQARGGYGVLFGLIDDSAGHFHGPGVGYMGTSTVFWRCQHTPGNSFDAHSTGPYATLLDHCEGGWTYGRTGGPLAGMPNHSRDLTVWNFKRTGGQEKVLDFWRQGYMEGDLSEGRDVRELFLDPIFVGFHGIETEFVESRMGYLEGLGAPVLPESLFEAQLKRRLGQFPLFLEDERRLWDARGD